LKWSGSKTICSYSDTDPAYSYPNQPRGICGSVPTNPHQYPPGTVWSLQAYKLTCRRARAVARRIGQRVLASGECRVQGCQLRIRGLRCTLDALHPGEYSSPTVDNQYPAERVACKRRRASMSAWVAVEPLPG
jgi:hypothetical protein